MGALDNKTILFSGVFEGHDRKNLEAQAEAEGAKLLSGVTKNLNYLVAGEKMGPNKKDKAEELGVPIISLQDFFDMVGGAGAQGAPANEEEKINRDLGIVTFYKTTRKTPFIWYPDPSEVLIDTETHKESLYPVLTFDAGALHPGLGHLPLHFLLNDVSEDGANFKSEADGRYTVQGSYSSIDEPPDFDLDRSFLTTSRAESNNEIATIRFKKPISWIQDDWTPEEDGKPMKYIGRLESHYIFGFYYLFYSTKTKSVSQIFQCT
jgi:hypothetical protein